jgi:hypothetical protein
MALRVVLRASATGSVVADANVVAPCVASGEVSVGAGRCSGIKKGSPLGNPNRKTKLASG